MVLRYLAEQFGEQSHVRSLESSRSRLAEAIRRAPGETACELFDACLGVDAGDLLA